ncbi:MULTISPECIES: Zn-ribbon domain-containing OB-fold protein [Rhodococcus]|jgi:uncharacterized OB-fold protein|uniref:OB-fold domain-containing protein n=1 Tax=Rhodococcus qingshengii TaxID=334542 RepID=A0AAW6LHB5_RHOSG|nr:MULTISPECIES: OB-fold domain-containing protein [Rhodococcus]KZF14824.1 benzoylsuccinyl-CoA thiolase [Rhodococcus sp. EPR-134]MDE8646369.1 OB-fold domain-containing protein [Rhodococcus qingshengii]NDK70147.1 benzoylsuccinyl-CoA thiolase [Rhodococcus qingshengii]UDF20923.1 OB-fold domain-containing protein [Rhodococcus qingshengii]
MSETATPAPNGSVTPAVEGWFTTGDEPALIGTKCQSCGTISFPREATFCKNPSCFSEEFDDVELSRSGTVWSYTDAQYQPPPPYIPRSDPYEPFALAAVELPEGIVILGQVADGFGVDDLKVGNTVELVVEPLYTDETGVRTTWRWKPVAAADQESQS